MQLTCPCCFARYALEAALTDDDARKAVAIAFKLPAPLGDLLLRYIGLFRPPKRALAWDRAARLLAEILDPIRAGRIERHGQAWAAPLDYWRESIEEILGRRDKLQLPPRNHGYLFEILASRASRAAGKAEVAAEAARRRRAHRTSLGTAPQPAGKLAGSLEEHLAKLRGAAKP